jgi:ubiquinone/menaquinone biosynthesis C-methylase UbiE
MCMFNRFDLLGTWNNYDSTDQIKKKAVFIERLIPADVRTIIDVGCGNGIITNELAKTWDVTGLDSSEAALQQVTCQTIQASAMDIPLPSGNFDLVLSSEMLEHLTDDELSEAVSELKRLSRKYLMISVPNREHLEDSFSLCPTCSYVFNACHHVQSFSKKRLEELLKPEYECVEYKIFGPLQKQWIPFLLKAKHKLGQWMYPGDAAICPNCFNTKFSYPKKNILTKLINAANAMLTTRKYYWQIMLLQKRQP